MGGGMGGMGQGPGAPPPEKPEGPAEEAPEKTQTDVATEALPAWPGQKEKAVQVLQLNGYMRGRGFFWHNLHLGHFNGNTGTGNRTVLANPFPPPYTEVPQGSTELPFGCAARSGSTDVNSCRSNGIQTADIRLRLEPTINISEQVRVKAQIDVFDNLVMGSTPEGFFVNGRGVTPDGHPALLSRGQVPQESAQTALTSSIRAKRAWGEVKLPIGELAFGRMPMMWGTGMLFHDGNCPDCDFGTTVDRVMGTVKAWDHFLSFSWDWAASGPTSQILYNQQQLGWQWNADNVDDVNQWTVALGRKDDEQDIKDRVDRGNVVLNYGAFLMIRTQSYDLRYNPRLVTGKEAGRDDNPAYSSPAEVVKSLERRDAWSLTPDLWVRLNWKKLHLEMEGSAVFGRYDVSSGNQTLSVKLQQFGGLVRGSYRFLKNDSLKVALEIGSASGPTNGDQNAELNWRRAQDLPVGGVTEHTQGRFVFDPDYHVDLLLFRRILGTVTNATYMKPSVTYWLIDSFGGQADVIYSLANRPGATPGHAINMGIELNARLMYRNVEEGFYAMLEYGVLFNLGALEQAQAIWHQNDGITIGSTTAQAFQAKVMFKF